MALLILAAVGSQEDGSGFFRLSHVLRSRGPFLVFFLHSSFHHSCISGISCRSQDITCTSAQQRPNARLAPVF